MVDWFELLGVVCVLPCSCACPAAASFEISSSRLVICSSSTLYVYNRAAVLTSE
jgi:hypothetical protein